MITIRALQCVISPIHTIEMFEFHSRESVYRLIHMKIRKGFKVDPEFMEEMLKIVKLENLDDLFTVVNSIVPSFRQVNDE